MKSYPPLFAACLAACLAAFIPLPSGGQEPAPPASRASIPHPLVVSEFVPPAPVAPKQIPAIRIDAATTVPAGNGKKLTLIRGEASSLPDLPPRPVPRPVVARQPTAEDVARETYRRHHNFDLGATVFVSPGHQVSLVRWQHPDTREPYEAVCGFDIGLLAGVGRFVRDGETYGMMLMHSRLDTTRIRNLAGWGMADVATIPENSIHYLKGDPADAIGTSPITLVKELIANEKARLQVFQADLERHRKARAAWEKANPVPPRDEFFVIRPHRGSRYLADPTPEATAR